jgi:hypothetical protein
MIKKQQKWIALLVVCTFMWLMQVSTMPVAAAGTTEQVSSAGAEQGPDYYEAISQKAAPAKKKSMLPIILIGVGLVAVTAAVLFLVVLKSYDITGIWNVTWQWTVGDTSSGTIVMTFTGTKKSGNLTDGYGDSGTYSADGKNVNWTLTTVDPAFKWTGKFDGKDKMSGTMVWPLIGSSGTWTATRSGTASVPKSASADNAKSPWK